MRQALSANQKRGRRVVANKMNRFVMDGDLNLLKGKVASIIGYGNQGQAQGTILRENGIEVIVGSIKDASWRQAEKDGFPVFEINEAVKRSDIALLLLPDEVAPSIYYEHIEREIKKKKHFVLDFASGYSMTYGCIKPVSNMDVVLVAPRMIGWGILDLHKNKKGYPVLLGVAQDASGKAWDYAKAIAKGIGAIGFPGGVVIKSSFREETFLDLLSEHTWVPTMTAAMRAYFDVVTEEYDASPEAAILELYASQELAEVAKSMAQIGMIEQMRLHSRTSQYGQFTRAIRFYEQARESTRKEAADIWSGEFAKEWSHDQASGCEVLNRMWKMARDSKLAQAEDRLYRILGRR